MSLDLLIFVHDDLLEKTLNLYIVKSMHFGFDSTFRSSFSPKDYITLTLWFFHDLTFIFNYALIFISQYHFPIKRTKVP